ncbi:MAG: hypothetical protein AMXMBFR84_19210 [Candidatus Hydrogenedentota bacterium]
MAAKPQCHGIEVLDAYIQKCRAFMDHWMLFSQIIGAYRAPASNKAQLEAKFLHIKSQLAKEHHVLVQRLGADCRFAVDMMNVLSSATNLQTIYSQSDVAIKKLHNEWHRAFIAINETIGVLEDKHKRVLAGQPVMVGGQLVKMHIKKPFPWRAVLTYGGGAAALFAVMAGAYFARNFLGIGAPGAGDGLVYSAAMSDEEIMQAMVQTMGDAIAAQDIDRIMTVFSDSFKDEVGRNKTELRVLLQGFKTTGGMENAVINASSARFIINGNTAQAGPVYISAKAGDATMQIDAVKENGQWLITNITGL